MAGPGLVGLMTAGCTSATTVRELWEKRFMTHRSWKTHSTPGATHRGWGGGREGVKTWGSAFIRVPGWACEVLWVHSLLANLKHKSGNWGTGRKKRDYLSGHLPGSPRAF